jgi:hypothetical protein
MDWHRKVNPVSSERAATIFPAPVKPTIKSKNAKLRLVAATQSPGGSDGGKN